MKKALIDYIKRGPNDEIYTPNEAIEPLLKYIPKNYKIWECTDFGRSNISELFIKNGYEVIKTHKKNFDFLNDTPNFEYDVIITNPPYSLKDEFLKKCFELRKPFAMLLPITTLEGVTRGGLFRKNGIQLIVFDRRINFLKQKKSNWFNTSWFCWNLLTKDLIFEEIKK